MVSQGMREENYVFEKNIQHMNRNHFVYVPIQLETIL